jgi:hypothetical protein
MRVAQILLLALFFCPCARSADTRVLTDAGAWLTGEVGINGGNVTVGMDTLPIGRLIAAVFPEEGVNAVDQAVVLHNGDVILGIVQDMQGNQLRFASDRFGAMTVPVDQIRGLCLTTRSLPLPLGDAEFTGVQLQNGDRVSGTAQWINEANVGVHNGRRIVEMPRTRVSFIHFAAKNPGQKALHSLRLRNGDRVSGEIRMLDAQQVTLRSTLLGEIKIPRQALVSLWNASAQPLGGMTAVVSRQVPRFREDFPVTQDALRDGNYLTVGGRRAEIGLGCHAGRELEFEIESCAALVADLGIDDAAASRGEATVAFFGDGKAIASVDLRPGVAKAVAVPLAGVRRLRIEVQSGRDQSTAGDSVDFCWAVLVKAP